MSIAPLRRTENTAVVLLLAAVSAFAWSAASPDFADPGGTSITLPAVEAVSQQLDVVRTAREVHVLFVWVPLQDHVR